MAKIIAIDYGGKRTGIAATDFNQIIVSPLVTIDTTDLTPWIKNYILTEKPERVVIGYSLNLDDSENPLARQAMLFAQNLEKHFPDLPIVFQDERYTSVDAADMMIKGGFSKKYRRVKSNTDKMAAALILQQYLDENTTE